MSPLNAVTTVSSPGALMVKTVAVMTPSTLMVALPPVTCRNEKPCPSSAPKNVRVPPVMTPVGPMTIEPNACSVIVVGTSPPSIRCTRHVAARSLWANVVVVSLTNTASPKPVGPSGLTVLTATKASPAGRKVPWRSKMSMLPETLLLAPTVSDPPTSGIPGTAALHSCRLLGR